MQGIAELNNFAVECITAKNLKEAASSLRTALQLAKSYVCAPNQLMETIPSPPISCNHASCVLRTPRSETQSPRLSVSLLPSTDQSTICTSDSILLADNTSLESFARRPFKNSSAIQFHQPILIHPESCCCVTSRYSTITTSMMVARHSGLSAIVIFNLALCHDVTASSSSSLGSSSQANMKAKAILLYEKVVELYVQSNTDRDQNNLLWDERPTGTVHDAVQDIVVMAAINNMVHLQDDEAQKDRYSRLLLHLTQQINGVTYGSEELWRQVEWQARIFLSNTVPWRKKISFTTTAAAA